MKSGINSSSLGIKILNCMNGLTNRHNDGNSYIVNALGLFTKQGMLEYGLRNLKTLIKASVKE